MGATCIPDRSYSDGTSIQPHRDHDQTLRVPVSPPIERPLLMPAMYTLVLAAPSSTSDLIQSSASSFEISVSLTVSSNCRQSHPLTNSQCIHALRYHLRSLLTLLLGCSHFLSNCSNHPRVRAGHSTHSMLSVRLTRVPSRVLWSSTRTYCLLPLEQDLLCFRYVSLCVLIALASFFKL